MKSAKLTEALLAQRAGHVEYGMMYESPVGLVHRKKVGDELAKTLAAGEMLFEKANIDGEVVVLHCSLLMPVSKGPAYTLKKERRKPIKGTKPWTKIPYRFEDVEVGDVVHYKFLDNEYSHKVVYKESNFWCSNKGLVQKSWDPFSNQEAYILKPYKETPTKKEYESKVETFRLGSLVRVRDKWTGATIDLLLVQVAAGEVKLIDPKHGNRFSDNTCSHSLGKVSMEDLQKLLPLYSVLLEIV